MMGGNRDNANRVQPSSTVFRQFDGPEAKELFVLCRPEPPGIGGVVRQTESAYRSLRETLEAEGAGLEHVVHETVFFRNIREDLAGFQGARGGVLREAGANCLCPASTFIEQPPLNPGARLEMAAFCVVPHHRRPAKAWNLRATPPCGCDDCSQMGAHVLALGDQKHLHAANIYGARGHAFNEAYSMFRAAEELLRQEGMNFREVVRTWIYLRDIDRDYDELNRARREFFRDTDISLRPASTGIHGAPFPDEHNFAMSIYAIESPEPLKVGVMTTPTLNEAWMYGSDFSRGLRVVEANKVALYVSGTASVDEEGRTAHVGDFEAQVDRMILNVLTLLEAQDASLNDLVSAVTYLKSPADAELLRNILHHHGLGGLPNALVHAKVCRPNLLCEMEAVAAVPRPE